MGNSWIKALFADLAPKSDKDSGYSSASFEDSKRDRWNRQRPQSSQPKPVTQDSHEYDLVAHARSSLQIADSGPHDDRALNSTSAARSHRHGPLGTGPNSQWQHTSESAQAPSPGHNGPSDLAGRRINNSTAPIPPPVGPRPILFPQEMPKLETGVDSTQADRKPISGDYLIGFVNPQQTPPRHRQEKSKPHLNFRHTASSSPQRYNGQASTSGSLPRPQHLSTPERPVFLTTLPPDTPHRPHSDPQSLGKVVKTPVVSRSNSDDSGKCKPNQCYGTTAAGKRCTRTVKSRVVTSVPSGKIAQPADVRLSRNALKQLDRRLSIRKKPAGPTKRMMDRRQRVFESGSDSEEDFDVTAARLAPIQGDLVTEEESLEELPVFCYQHVKQTLEQRGTFINTKYVDFQGKRCISSSSNEAILTISS